MNQFDKQKRRQELLQIRNTLLNKSELDTALAANLIAFLATQPQSSILAYYAIKAEFDVLNCLITWLPQTTVKQIFLPVVQQADKSMRFKAWQPESLLQQDAYGINYPVDGEYGEPKVWLIPCLGYSRNGFRLGYGAGYYDRAIANYPTRPLTVGIAYSVSEIKDFTNQPHDQQLDYIITDHEIIQIN